MGPLFGAVVARALDAWWVELGEPDVYTVIDAGAGPGTLARAVLAARPRCAEALRYVLVERAAPQRDLHRSLPLVAAHLGFEPPDDDAAPVPRGPLVMSLDALPAGPVTGVVLANELLDNLPFDLVERSETGWCEVRVGADDNGLVEVLVPIPADGRSAIERLVGPAPIGARAPLQHAAAEWLADALAIVERGRVVVIDYAVARTADVAGRSPTDWLRTYRGHERGGAPLTDLGHQDVTVEVALDQLGLAANRTISQAQWLREHGIDALVDEGRRTWAERAHLGDLTALRARSRVSEADALLDPGGLGGFLVAEWVR